MRQLAATVFLGGCSFIFNPDHINRDIDAHVIVVDTEVIADVDITALKLEYAYPAIVYEGAGQANARPSLVVIRGEQISPTATVTVVPATGNPAQITVNDIKIAGDSNWIAISISAPVDLNQDQTGTKMASPVPLIVTVDNGGGTVRSLPPEALSLTFLDQLIAPIAASGDPKKLYSNIAISAAQSFTTGIGRIELHSMSGISFGAGITLDGGSGMGSGSPSGPGGCAGATAVGGGGASQSTFDMTTCDSGASVGDNAGGTAGGYAGDVQISNFAAAVPGGGGGGGKALVGLAGGSTGGGGGGMISLEARGDMTITKNGTNVSISAKGALGGAAGLNSGGSGGGGAGGTVLLKSGGTLTITGSVLVNGGDAGTGGTPGAPGVGGHIRFDAAHGSAPSGYIGPMFQTVPYFSYDALTQAGVVTLTGTSSDTTSFVGQAFDKDLNAPDDGKFALSFSGSGVAMPRVMLSPGYNKICATVPSGNLLDPDSGNCAEIAYLPGPHP